MTVDAPANAVSDEAVEAAIAAYEDAPNYGGSDEAMHAALTAALPFLMPKALVRHDMTEEAKERLVAGWRKARGDVIMSIVHEAVDGEDEIERLNKDLGAKYAEIARLQRLLDQRDAFIVGRNLWDDFVKVQP